MAILTRLGVPGEPGAWAKLGFTIVDGTFRVGNVIHQCGNAPSWDFAKLYGVADLGVPTGVVPAPLEAGAHANQIDRVDHVVYAVPALDPAVDALTTALGEPPRRRAFPRGPTGPEMAFFTVGGGVFIEVVGSGLTAGLWGIAYLTPDLDACVAAVRAAGGPIGDPKPAVQGGRIASVWKEHVGWGVAVMEPPSQRWNP